MKKNLFDRNARMEAARILRMEDLEARALLSVNPVVVSSSDSTVELASQNAVVIDDAIDLSDVSEASTGDLTFTATDVDKQYTIEWDAIKGADLYNVRVSRDGGENWTTYAKTTENSVTVKGLEPGRTYSYQVSGLVTVLDVNGNPVHNASGTVKYTYVSDAETGERVLREGAFSPISIASTRLTYLPTDSINLTFKGAETASASIKWSMIVDGEEVEIAAAADQLSYTPTLEEANYDIKVVATGTGESEGSSKEILFRVNSDISATYDMDNHTAQVSWTEVEGAASYKLRIWRPATELTRTLEDGTTETYTRPAGFIDYVNTFETTTEVRGLYANNSEAYVYKFKVIAYDETGAPIGYRAGAFAPVSIKAARSEYKVGDEISVTIKTAGQYSSVEWYVTDDAAGSSQAKLALVDEEDDSDVNLGASLQTRVCSCDMLAGQNVKVVVKGSGLSAGAVATALVTITENQLQSLALDPYVTVDRGITASWDLVDGAAGYRFLKGSYDENGNLVWKKAATINVAENADDAEEYVVTSGNATIVDGKLNYTVQMFSAGAEGNYKVVAVDAKGKTLEEAQISYTNFALELDHDAYSLEGDTLYTAPLAVDAGEPVDYQWYVSYDQGETWTAIDGANNGYYTISAEEAAEKGWYKLLATTEDAASVAYAKPASVGRPADVVRSLDDANNLTLTFDAVEGATGYQVEYYDANGECPVWLNMTKVSYTENADGTIAASHVNGSNYDDCEVRVRALTDEGWSAWDGVAVDVALSTDSYVYYENGYTISASVNEGAKAEYAWYGAMDGDPENWVLIASDVASLSSAAVASYDMVKVVATGVGDSEGFSDEAIAVSVYERPSLVVTTTEDVVNSTDHLVSLREAVLYQKYLLAQNEISANDAITFDVSVFTEDSYTIALSNTTATAAYRQGSKYVYNNAAQGGKIVVANDVVIDATSVFEANGVRPTIDGSALKNVSSYNYGGYGYYGRPGSSSTSTKIADLYVTKGTLSVKNMAFDGMTASSSTAIYAASSTASVKVWNCVFTDNVEALTGVSGSSISAVNTLVDDNDYAIETTGSLRLVNCTITNNTYGVKLTDANSFGAVSCSAVVVNTLFWDNVNYSFTSPNGASVAIDNVLVKLNSDQDKPTENFLNETTYPTLWICVEKESPINEDGSIANIGTLRVVDRSTYRGYTDWWGRYTATWKEETASIYETGSNVYLTEEEISGVDLAGNPRLSGGFVDIGAFEYQDEDAAAAILDLVEEGFFED